MKKLLSLLLLFFGCVPPGAAAVTAYKDAAGSIYFEGLPKLERSYDVVYSAGSVKYDSVWMYKEEPSKIACDLHVIWHSKKDFRLTNNITILAAPGGDLTFDYRTIYNASPFAPKNSNPCIQPAALWKTIRPGIQALSVIKDRWSYKWFPSYGPNAGKLTTGYKATQTLYIRGLPGAAYRVRNTDQIERFARSNLCGFIKLANTETWTAQITDKFWLYDPRDLIGTYTRSTLPIKTLAQIPKCFDGKRFMFKP